MALERAARDRLRNGLAPERPGAGEMHALVPMLLEAFSAPR